MAAKLNSSAFQNRLLRSLPASDLAAISSRLKPVDLPLRFDLEHPNKPIEHVYFLETGLASMVARGPRKRQLEVGMMGREGMTGLVIVLGDHRTPHSTFMQMAGHGHRLASDDLRKLMAGSDTLRAMLLRYAQAFLLQSTHTAMSNGSARLDERLARWLLMAHDRAEGDQLALIHEFLALMLGVQRPGVTVAIHSLEGRGLIRATRGNIAVLDRKGLEAAANGSYGAPEAEYRRLFATG
jgi:CRP-like cAMP-binding protein